MVVVVQIPGPCPCQYASVDNEAIGSAQGSAYQLDPLIDGEWRGWDKPRNRSESGLVNDQNLEPEIDVGLDHQRGRVMWHSGETDIGLLCRSESRSWIIKRLTYLRGPKDRSLNAAVTRVNLGKLVG